MTDKEPFKMKPWKFYVLYGLALIGLSMVLWPLFGYLLAKMNGMPFVYDIRSYLVRPVLFGLLLGLYNYHVDSNRR